MRKIDGIWKQKQAGISNLEISESVYQIPREEIDNVLEHDLRLVGGLNS